MIVPQDFQPGQARFFRLGPEHLDEVLALEKECFSHPWTEKQYLLALEQKVFNVFGLAQEDRLLAYGSFYHAGGEMEILNLAVRPGVRRRGLARRLLGLMLQIAVKMGIRYAYLEVRRSNEPARQLYAGFGFEETGVRKAYYPDNGEDAVLLRCDLAPDQG